MTEGKIVCVYINPESRMDKANLLSAKVICPVVEIVL